MSSLKGQLSNVEGSVKSMKVAVVVGSVLTVACLAAVFGVTVLANEVSKEVKVSNGALTSKSGQAVVTSDVVGTKDLTPTEGDETLVFGHTTGQVNARVTSSVITADSYIYIVDGAMMTINKASGVKEVTFVKDSLLASAMGVTEDVEKRQLNPLPALVVVAAQVGWWAAKLIFSAIATGVLIGFVLELCQRVGICGPDGEVEVQK